MYDKFVANQRLRRAVVLLGTFLILFLMRRMMNIILLTFIFSFLTVKVVRRVQKHINVKPIWVVLLIYALIIYLIYLAATIYLPQLANQIYLMFQSLTDFYNHNPDLQKEPVFKYALEWIEKANLDDQLKLGVSKIITYITNIGEVGMTIFVSFILSFFYAFDVDQVDKFGRQFLKSDYSWLFEDLHYFFKTFVNTFGVVLEAQLLIAAVNTVITAIGLVMMKIPSVLALSVMVFLLSMVPVAGAIISLIPLSMVAFSVGGIRDVIYVILMIAGIHALETYFLNPKFMSHKTHLPMFFTFVILLVAEKLIGPWGLIVGIPIFSFILEIIGVKTLPQKQIKKINLKTDRR